MKYRVIVFSDINAKIKILFKMKGEKASIFHRAG